MEKENIQMISLVIPLLNEDESIEKLHQKINGVLKKNNYPFEIIYIDDGSTDNSVKKIEHLRKNSEEKIKIIQFRRNFGKAAALSAGFKEAEGDLIITMDADLQDEPEEIPKMINKINEGYDLVSGWKQDRKDPKIKLFSSKINSIRIKLNTI